MNHQIPKILIVDDQSGIRRTMTGIIEDTGSQVVDVEDGYQAIDQVKNENFDLVFLDIKMPGINGIQTFREIKKLKTESLVAMMTGFDVAELIDASFDEGAIAVIYKPFTPTQVTNIIRAATQSDTANLPKKIGTTADQIQREIDRVVKELPIARVEIRIPDSELRALRLLAVSGPAVGPTRYLCSSVDLAGSAFYKKNTQIINDYPSDPLSTESDIKLGVKSAVAIPISSESNWILGSMVVSCFESDHFYPEVDERLLSLARSVGNIMEAASATEAESLHALNGSGMSSANLLVNAYR